MKKINVYDFDKTLYNGDSSIDFFFYCLKNRYISFISLIKILFFSFLYFGKIISTKKYKEKYFSFILKIKDLNKVVNSFWNKNKNKLNKELIEKINNSHDNVIITASPEFLIKPIEKILKVKVIGTKLDVKTGLITGENCCSDEKIKRLNEYQKNYEIEEFYSDSLKDAPLAKIAHQSYLVENSKILDWNEDYLINKSNRKTAWKLFLIFLFIFFIGNILINFSFNLYKKNNFMFQGDSKRVFQDFVKIYGNHKRTSIHPLIILLVQPCISLLKGIFVNELFSVIVFSSIVGALNVVVLYNFCTLFSNNKKLNILIPTIFGISFSNIIFICGVELYNLAALCLIYLWYVIAKILKEKMSINKKIYGELCILGILTIAVTLSNYVIFLIASFTLLISKKIKLRNIIFLNLAVVCGALLLSYYQNYCWHNTAVLAENFTNSVDHEASYYSKFELSFQRVKNVVKDNYYNSVMASDLKAVEEEVPGYYTLHFTKMPILNIVIMTLFYGVLAICLIKNYKKNVSLNTGLCLSLLFNSLLHYLYGNDSVYLYSQHFLYLIFLLAALNLLTNKKENQKILQKFLTVFLLIQCVVNFMRFGKVHELLNKYMVRTFWSNTFSTITLIIIFTLVFIITILLLWFIYRNMKNLINKKDNKMYYAFIIIISLCLLNGLFVALQTTQTYQKIGFIDLNLIKK